MIQIKLDAIDSTNDYLKSLCKLQIVNNFTVVTAVTQTNGRGQIGAKWLSMSGKNIIMSILIKNILQESTQIFDLNVAVSTAIISVLESFSIPSLAIKWPNDIMADGKKIGGILIENRFKADKSIESVVGIGLNVNQTDFENLPNAASLSIIMNQEYDLDLLLGKIVDQIKKNCQIILDSKSHEIWTTYHNYLYKKNIPTTFEDEAGTLFIGTIQSVTKEGKLLIEKQNESLHYFNIKQLKMIL